MLLLSGFDINNLPPQAIAYIKALENENAKQFEGKDEVKEIENY